MASEVAQERIVMGGEVADTVIFFRAGVDYGGGMMGETGKVGSILL